MVVRGFRGNPVANGPTPPATQERDA